MITCEPSTSTMSAPARWACDRTTSAPAALSPLATTAQDASLRQAGGPDTSLNAAAAMGRWVAPISAMVCSGRSAAKASRTREGLIANSTEVCPRPGRIGVLDQGRVQDAVLGAVFDIAQVLAFIGGEGRYVDQADDVRGAGRGIGDDRAAVGVPAQQHRTADLAEQAGDVGGIGGHAAERIGRSDDGVTLLLQPLDHAVPAGGVREGAVHQHDGRLHIGLLGTLAGRIHEGPPAVRTCAHTLCPPGMMPERMG
jgi:hypothetical protein